MHPLRRDRLLLFGCVLAVSALVAALTLYALRENINLFYPPSAFAEQAVPLDRRIRLGGLLKEGSLVRDGEGLGISFVVTDGSAEVVVRYSGVVPNLFAEGRGVVATGALNARGVFVAESLLAKHDENYKPPGL